MHVIERWLLQTRQNRFQCVIPCMWTTVECVQCPLKWGYVAITVSCQPLWCGMKLSSSMCTQYCEYSANPSKCYEWMKTHLPTHYARIVEHGECCNCSQVASLHYLNLLPRAAHAFSFPDHFHTWRGKTVCWMAYSVLHLLLQKLSSGINSIWIMCGTIVAHIMPYTFSCKGCPPRRFQMPKKSLKCLSVSETWSNFTGIQTFHYQLTTDLDHSHNSWQPSRDLVLCMCSPVSCILPQLLSFLGF